ncbi:signal transduction histidine kinase/HPt (histidine-containing phosphotransfer) domain-containing protein [Rhodopseudomonas rhenobacensis]|uniref:Sensory/regulatory protein RpfC n=1 Tax=Rhodopseudomonas rhenobacensis TaxID=87461 RepID=A0A7W8DY56_9BRAD|nr:signal transduction histidine kinase/HPt (histidine-containing phosphotransfer) domain-containing protein [Rhodopseudomonas rhenobacensis]
MFKHSLAKLVLVLHWTSILALVTITSLLAAQEWFAFVDADRIVVLTRADRVLFTSMTGIRFEVGVAGVAVLSQDQPDAMVEASNRKVDGLFTSAIAAIEASQLESRGQLLAAARDAYADLERSRPLLSAMTAQPVAARDMATADPWLMAMYDVAERLQQASIAVGNSARMLDPEIAELVQLRQASYVIRERYGRPCSALRANVQRSLPLDREKLASWREGVGEYTARWRYLESYLNRPGASPQLVADVTNGRIATETVQKQMDDVLYGLDGSGEPAMPAAEWSQLCISAYGPILKLGNDALDQAIAHAEQRKTQASLMLAAMAVVVTAGILLVGFWILTVRRRLSAPMKMLVDTIGRLSRREFAVPVPATGYPDEMGAMAGALEDLRVGALKAQHLQRLLEKAQEVEIERANEVSRAKTDFLATMSHEIRTPLNGILGMAQLLDDSPLSAQQRQWLDAVAQSGSLLLSILNDILDLSKIEAGRMELESIAFSPDELLHTIAAAMTPQAAGKGLAFLTDYPALPARLIGDPAKISQVLLNLVGNAVKFTHSGEVVLSVNWQPDVEHPDRGRMEFKVTDTGIGISRQAVRHVFDPFSQSDSSITRRFGGSGLGLAICKRIIDAMGGRISVESTLGCGSVFTVALDFVVAPPVLQGAEATAFEAMPQLSILLAEDNEVNAAVARAMLQKMGHTVDHAAHGLTAAALAGEHDYDVVLTDLAMPGLDGIGLAKVIRALPHATRREVPIIALTANVAAGRIEQCFAAGMTGYIEKPFRQETLRHALADAVGALEDEGLPHATRTGSLLEQRCDDLGEEKTNYIIDLFVSTAPSLIAEANHALQSGDAKAFGDAAHRLKSAAGNVGLNHLARLAQLAERAAAANDHGAMRRCAQAMTAKAPGKIEALQRSWASVLSARGLRSDSQSRAR